MVQRKLNLSISFNCQKVGNRSSHLSIGKFPVGIEKYSYMDGRIYRRTTGYRMRLYIRINGTPCKELKNQKVGLSPRHPGHTSTDSRVDTWLWTQVGRQPLLLLFLGLPSALPGPVPLPSSTGILGRRRGSHSPGRRSASSAFFLLCGAARLLSSEKPHSQAEGGCWGPGPWAGGPQPAPPVSNDMCSNPSCTACLLPQERGKDEACQRSLPPATPSVLM